MSEKISNLKRMQIADALKSYPSPQNAVPPRSGWVRAIREALGMTQAQLGTRMGISRQSVQDLEQAEAERRITLDSLDRLARAMDCRVVYSLVPEHGSLDDVRMRRAQALAKALLKQTDHTMKLEAQGLSENELGRQRKALAETLLRDKPSKLW
jgi:predicted DNA-binding mobile mystery protein A